MHLTGTATRSLKYFPTFPLNTRPRPPHPEVIIGPLVPLHLWIVCVYAPLSALRAGEMHFGVLGLFLLLLSDRSRQTGKNACE